MSIFRNSDRKIYIPVKNSYKNCIKLSTFTRQKPKRTTAEVKRLSSINLTLGKHSQSLALCSPVLEPELNVFWF